MFNLEDEAHVKVNLYLWMLSSIDDKDFDISFSKFC